MHEPRRTCVAAINIPFSIDRVNDHGSLVNFLFPMGSPRQAFEIARKHEENLHSSLQMQAASAANKSGSQMKLEPARL
jgi:hypothetical protein